MCSCCIDFWVVIFSYDCHRNDMKMNFPPNTPSNSVVVCIFNISMVTLGIPQNTNVPTIFLSSQVATSTLVILFPCQQQKPLPMDTSFYSWNKLQSKYLPKINVIIQSPLYCYILCGKTSFFQIKLYYVLKIFDI